MALLALGGISVLVIALLVTFICLGAGGSTGYAAAQATPRFDAQGGVVGKQYANTPVSAMGVHHLASPAACWPGVWVGPSPAQAYPGASSAGAPMQRRHPSGIAARATSHGALR